MVNTDYLFLSTFNEFKVLLMLLKTFFFENSTNLGSILSQLLSINEDNYGSKNYIWEL